MLQIIQSHPFNWNHAHISAANETKSKKCQWKQTFYCHKHWFFQHHGLNRSKGLSRIPYYHPQYLYTWICMHTFSSCCFSLLFSVSLCSNCEASFTVAWFRAFSFSWASLWERGLPGAGGAAWSASNWVNLKTTFETSHFYICILSPKQWLELLDSA